ncbi:DUF4142 domain-containing protein [Azoarcus olearius]|uniref:Conserved hypothetical secreted protein n=1 Tax=Azoarcus sp. (strain BH72) TaxID=418699 RepID=A1K6F3_AZOSB|nr:DUF4142 domain-containing protein [Azoarcus olearius]ANQ84978.1 hypothetical protein dqs_1940 [Azoarcus olearius]CAL94408.1 conserved hypothetical secreted protein [Azoarcus olearius]
MDAIRLRRATALLALASLIAACDRKPNTAPPQPPTSTQVAPSVPPETPPLPPAGGTAGSTQAPVSSISNVEPGPVSEADRNFIAAATGHGLAQMEAGRLVAEGGGNADVKAFAEQLRHDHEAINVQLARLASAKKLTAAEAMPEHARADLAEMRKLSGTQLDQLFLARFSGAAHAQVIEAFERQAREGADPEIRAFAQDTLAILRRHVETARGLQQKLATGAR